MKKFIYLFVCLLPLMVTAQVNEIMPAPDTVKPVVYPVGYTAMLNVVYTKVGDWEGRADVYLTPKNLPPAALVINIHGGGWNHGTKESQIGFPIFFKAGMAVMNVEYRLTPQATAPAAVEDVRCALLYAIANAKAWNVDPDKIILMGGSAGGHLALMAGLLENDNRFDKNCVSHPKVKVAAIIDKYGITDVWDWGYGKRIRSKSALNWLGQYKNDSMYAATVSPLTYVKKTSPPTLIVHGDADPTVPIEHSQALYEKMKAAGVRSDFIVVPGGLHGKFTPEQNSMVNKAVIEFIKPILQK